MTTHFYLIICIHIVKAVWITPSDPLMPYADDEMAIGAYNDTIWLIGAGNYKQRKQTTQFKVVTQTFTNFEANALSSSIRGHSQYWSQQNHIIYLIDPITGNSFCIYDLMNNQFTSNWMDITFSTNVGYRGCLSSTPQHLYVSGGYNGQWHNILQIVSLSSYEWVNSPPNMNVNRSSHACIVHNNYLWAIGGFDGSSKLKSIERVFVPDITNNEWILSSDLSTRLSALRVVEWYDTLYVVGGWDSYDDRVDMMHVIDGNTGDVSLSPDSLPFIGRWISPIIYDDILYAFGGMGSPRDKWAYYPLPQIPSHPSTVTPDPSNIPTQTPSKAPIKVPSDGPSKAPTVIPSEAPTPAPIPAPNPTKKPTPNPTRRPTPNPTRRPTPNPTKRPTPNPTKRPTPNPTLDECVYISNFDANLNGEWESQSTYGGQLAYKKDANWLFYTDESGLYYWGIYTSLESGDNSNVWDLGWCGPGETNIENCDGSWQRNSGGTDTDAQFVKAICGSITPQPTLNPTKKPTPNPTKKPTKKPTPNPTKKPTKKPTINPTKRPTPNPTKKPTANPTGRPTTPSPTQPGTIACGRSSTGAYSNAGDPLIIEVRMPFTGELIFDASNSNFAITGIDAKTKLGTYLGSDSDNDGIISLKVLPLGDYQFVLMGDSTGTYHVQVQCVSDEPTAFPTSSPTQYPTKRPSPSPTKRPTSDPTKRPTSNPSKTPTAKPTTPSPTQPGTMTCGASTVGQYSNAGDELIIEVRMPFTGELMFDASNSNFAITGIDAQTKLGANLGSDSDHDGIVSVNPAPSGDYKFVMTGAASGVYHVQIRCVSDEPTVFPTQSPTQYPTKRPSYAPVNHPARAEPSVSPVTSKPTTAIPTVLTTDGPTDRPTFKTPTEVIELIEATEQPMPLTTSPDSNDEGSDEDEYSQGESVDMSGIQTAVYVALSFICCCICVCMMMVFYKYCYGDMKTMMEIRMEMMRPSQDNIVASNVIAVNSEITHAFERDLVRQWLIHTVKLPQYAEKLFGQGYDNLRAIHGIDSREELARCGIEIPAHQTLLLAVIAAAKVTECGTLEVNNTNAFDGELVPLPPEIGGVDGEGVTMTDVGDEDLFETDCGHANANVTLGTKIPPAADAPFVLDTHTPMTSGMAMNNTSAWPPPPPPDNWAQDYYVNTVGGNI